MTVLGRDSFVDPATGQEYLWHLNHSSEEAGQRTRRISVLKPTAIGWQQAAAIKQQGVSAPQLMRLAGAIFEPAQHEQFLRFWRLSEAQTVHFVHCSGERYEVLVRTYEPQRKGVVRSAGGLDHMWRYTIEMEVVARIA